MTNSTLVENDVAVVAPESQIRSGNVYTTDPYLDRAPESKYGRNEFLKFRDIRPIVTTSLAALATGLFVLAGAFVIGNVFNIAAAMLAIAGVGVAAAAVVVGSRRSHRNWAYQLASYIGVASAVLAVLTIANIYFASLFTTGANL
jgi:7-keto-8-aminopelargonate synthetase-like enzyme